jgi:hypothetical protein
MAKAKHDNLLYIATIAELNKALPMEWTIRALRMHNSAQYQRLQAINSEIYNFWLNRSFLKEEIDDLELMEFSWDFLQIGKSTSRSFTKVISPYVHQKVSDGLQDVYKQWNAEIKNINLPCIAQNYRYFDVLHGNDIERLLKKVGVIVGRLSKYTKDQSIPISEFAIFMRTPRRLNNESLIFHGPWIDYEGRKLENSLMLIINTDVKIESFQTILNEFIIEYWNKRKSYLKSHPEAEPDDLPDRLLTEVLNKEMLESDNQAIDQCNQVIGPLVGLYAWDCFRKNKNIKSTGISKILNNFFNITRGDSLIRKDHDKTKEEINALIYKCSLSD